eukprot:2460069-Rhodomonas_salina.2
MCVVWRATGGANNEVRHGVRAEEWVDKKDPSTYGGPKCGMLIAAQRTELCGRSTRSEKSVMLNGRRVEWHHRSD